MNAWIDPATIAAATGDAGAAPANDNSAADLVACSWGDAAKAIGTWIIGSLIFAAVFISWAAR